MTTTYRANYTLEPTDFDLESFFDDLCREYLDLSSEETQGIWKIIESKFSEPTIREYHTLAHVKDLINVMEPYKDDINDQNAVYLAIFFHDLIYNPELQNNEEKSAEAFSAATKRYLSEDLVRKVTRYILATKTHKSPSNNTDKDLDYFLDLDMSILGRDREEYEAYTKKIRREFIHVEEQSFNNLRLGFLRSMLSNETKIFATIEFQTAMEEKARMNIAWEISEIEKALE